MKVMVSGGAGFIGSTLVDRLLTDGHDVDPGVGERLAARAGAGGDVEHHLAGHGCAGSDHGATPSSTRSRR